MAMRENILLFLALWLIIAALATPSFAVFIVIALIGILITLEIGEFYLPKDVKSSLKLSAYLLLLAFAFIMARKVYEILRT